MACNKRLYNWHACPDPSPVGGQVSTVTFDTRLAAAFLVASGCSSPNAADLVRVQTQTNVAARGAPVRFAALNTGDATVYLQACGGRVLMIVQRRQGDSWQDYSGAACLAIYSMSPLALAPGAERSDSLALGDPGQYRLRLGVSLDGSNPAEWNAISNPFDVR